VVTGILPGMVAAGLVSQNEATWLGSMRGRKTAIAAASHAGGKAAGKSVKKFAHQVVELAFVRDRINRGFGNDRVNALLVDETYRVYGARAGAPALQGLAGLRV
jgi:protease PrsW